MSQKYEKLKTLLKELFQLDQPDLDFGLYRIMHAKSAEVTEFLEKDLLPQVQASFAQYKTADKAEIETALAKAIEQAHNLGADPETLPKVKELRARLASEAVDVGALESEVYDHLYSFFRRYYAEGDFVAKRVYKPGVYAIPYEGEEVTLHWANKDQYYIKTSEYLRDYAFRLRPDDEKNPMRVHFRLVDAAEGEHGNVKAAEGKERRFKIAMENPLSVEADELVIRFTYQPDAASQKELNAQSEAAILASSLAEVAAWIAELGKPFVRADETSPGSRLRLHLNRYSARNTFDYFIHKDLGGFLRRELDFYIKNEVMQLDDVESETAPRVEQYLSKLKVIRRIAGKVIAFLAQLEDFQLSLWSKRKTILDTRYLVALCVVPRSLYAEIAGNAEQCEEWRNICRIDEVRGDLATPAYSVPPTEEFLASQPSLLIDTRHFDSNFVYRLVDALGDLSELSDGLLVHGENFQSLRLMGRSLRERVQCISIDPPYNTGEDGFPYKDQYKDSSWISMMVDRLSECVPLLRPEGAAFVHIDDTEYRFLWHALVHSFGRDAFLGTLVWKRRSASAMSDRTLSLDHEYIIGFGRDASKTVLHGLERSQDDYPLIDLKTGRRYASDNLTIGMTREQRPNQYYSLTNPRTGNVFPANPSRVWRFFPETMAKVIADDRIIWPDEYEGNLERPRYKTFFDPENMKPKALSSWIESVGTNDRDSEDESDFDREVLACGMNAEGSRVIDRLFGHKSFAYPKPVSLIRSIVRATTRGRGLVLDFFAGSGTTGHAVVSLNREDGARRQVVLVESGDAFESVLLPRIKKVAYSPEWKEGKPKRLATAREVSRGPRVFKVVRLESYEDTLNNLDIRRTQPQQLLLDSPDAQGPGSLKEQYMLRYMLDVETRGSQSLLNVQAFADPTAYTLKVKRPGSDESRDTNVDLLETFNWLIGLTVRHIAAPQTFSAEFERDTEKRLQIKGRIKQEATGPYWFRTVTGTTPDMRKTLIIWRKLTGDPEQDNLVLDAWFTKQGYSARDSEFDLIYVNGGNNLENLKTSEDTWKVRLIEEDFHRLMFDTENV